MKLHVEANVIAPSLKEEAALVVKALEQVMANILQGHTQGDARITTPEMGMNVFWKVETDEESSHG